MRGAVLWIGGRLLAQVNLAMAQIDGKELLPFWSVVITALLCLADLHRRKETMLLNNLAIGVPSAVLISTIPAVMLETTLAVVQ